MKRFTKQQKRTGLELEEEFLVSVISSILIICIFEAAFS